MIQKSQIKKKKKILMGRFPLSFSISSDKKGGKSKWFCFFSVKGEGKCEKKYKKRKKNFFSFREVF